MDTDDTPQSFSGKLLQMIDHIPDGTLDSAVREAAEHRAELEVNRAAASGVAGQVSFLVASLGPEAALTAVEEALTGRGGTAERARIANLGAQFMPPDPGDPHERPGILLPDGQMCFFYYDHQGTLRVSVHSESEEPRAVRVSMEGGVVFEAAGRPGPAAQGVEQEFEQYLNRRYKGANVEIITMASENIFARFVEAADGAVTYQEPGAPQRALPLTQITVIRDDYRGPSNPTGK